MESIFIGYDMFKFKKGLKDPLFASIIDMVENYSEVDVIKGSIDVVQTAFGGYRMYYDSPKKKKILLFVSDTDVIKYLSIKLHEQDDYIQSMNRELEEFSSETNRQLHDIQREK